MMRVLPGGKGNVIVAMGNAILHLLALVLLMSGFGCAEAQQNQSAGESPSSKGAYLGEPAPGAEPSLFSPGVVSTSANEVNSVFTPDGLEFYFSRFEPGSGYTIMMMREEGGVWTAPQVAPFSGSYSEVDMFITMDGQRLYYISKRPIEKGAERSLGYQIWVMERNDGGWGDPRHLGPSINFGTRQLYPTLGRDETLCFSSRGEDGDDSDIYLSRYVSGQFAEPENVGLAVNSSYEETDALIAPDGSFMIFTSVDRPEGLGGGDLYISFQNEDGSWNQAQNMGDRLNTESNEFSPILSPDGNYFFFTSGRAGNDDIYWVDASVIEHYLPVRED
jgi:Tol biopolymer transport system component